MDKSERLAAAKQLLLHSGNIASWSKLRKKGALKTTEELVSAGEAAVKSWMGREADVDDGEPLVIRNSGLAHRVSTDEGKDYVFTVKLFLSRWDRSLIRPAVQSTLSELGLVSVDNLILSFPPCSEDELTLKQLQPVWEEMEQLAIGGMARTIGVADLFRAQLKELHDWAKVKPMIDQVNLAHCCTIPEDLVEFSKEKGVNLHTHNDEREVLPPRQLDTLLSPSATSHDVDHAHWIPAWVIKYSSIIRLRGIISHKGYLVGIEKST